jgi:hypothetical protein
MTEVLHTDGKVLRLNAPDWFAREDFVAWLNAPSTATWHRKGQDKVGEMADAFFTHCDGDGSDSPMPDSSGIPDDIWQEICQLAVSHFGDDSECLVWVSNLQQ